MTSTLIGKIAAASLKVGALATDRTNAQQKYDYISADKVLTVAGAALAQSGVVIFPSITSESTEAVKTDKGGTRYDAVVHFAMIVTDGATQMEMPWTGRGNDYSVPDKALYKAITSGHKYFLMKLLNIGVGNEDGEHEAPDAAFHASKPERASKAVLTELGDVGAAFYGGEWSERLPELVKAVTKGATSDVSELLPVEASKLIDGIRKKMAVANAEVATGK